MSSLSPLSASTAAFSPSEQWRIGQITRNILQAFLAARELPAQEAGEPLSDIDNIAEATHCVLAKALEGCRRFGTADYRLRIAREVVSMACEIAATLGEQLENRGAWRVSATVALHRLYPDNSATALIQSTLETLSDLPLSLYTDRHKLSHLVWDAIANGEEPLLISALDSHLLTAMMQRGALCETPNGAWTPAATPHAFLWNGPAPDIEAIERTPAVQDAIARMRAFEQARLAGAEDRPVIVFDTTRA